MTGVILLAPLETLRKVILPRKHSGRLLTGLMLAGFLTGLIAACFALPAWADNWIQTSFPPNTGTFSNTQPFNSNNEVTLSTIKTAITATAIAGGGEHTIALKSNGTLWTWGDNNFYQLGLGNRTGRRSPIQVGTDTNWQAIAAGLHHSLALKDNGTLWAWGFNNFGQLGVGDILSRSSPVQVGTGSNWQAIIAGLHHTMALKKDGTLWAWGFNEYGQLGLGDTNDRDLPVRVGAANNWTAITTGYDHTIALKDNGTLWTWGDNIYGQLGLGDTNERHAPVQISTDTTWQAIAAGRDYSIALATNGTLWVWGRNDYSQLGLGNTLNRTSPTRVGKDTDWQAIAAGWYHSLVLKQNGTLWTWGYNASGQLGLGNTFQGYAPARVGQASNWQVIRGGGHLTLAIQGDKSLWTWGRNYYGQLGLGDTTNRFSPTRVVRTKYVTAGRYVSDPIIPTGTCYWGLMAYSAIVPTNTTLTIDVLNASDNSLLIANVPSVTDLQATYPDIFNSITGIKLRGNFSTSAPEKTPSLCDWSVSYPSPGADLTISAGVNNPPASNELNDTLNLPMLQVNLAVASGNEAVKINSLKLTASGTVDDKSDISAVRLILDANHNGLYDTGETVLTGPATYSADNGTLTMTLSTPRIIAVGESEDWLVVYTLAGTADISETLAVGIKANADINAVGASSGCTIIASGAPVAGPTKTISDVSADITSGTTPLRVKFASQFGTEDTVVQYEWDFDYDGITFRPDFSSNLTGDISAAYEIAGTYTSHLRITYADGTVIYRDITITVSAPPGSPDISGVSAEPLITIEPAPLTIVFTVSATTDNGKIEAYFSDFDGDDIIDFTSTTTDTAVHTYTAEGTYTVVVQVQNSEGLMTEYELTVTVESPSQTPPAANITQPVVDPTTIYVGENISFVGEGITGTNTGSIVKYEWDFDGDGSYDQGGPNIASANYTYMKTGEFTARLRVTESSGLTGEDTVAIIVTPDSAPRVAIEQPGVPIKDKDGLRRTVNGNITVKAISVPVPATETLDLRYRLVGETLPDTLEDIPPDRVGSPIEPQHSTWQTEALTKSTFVTADAGAEGFITRINTNILLANNWYEIIAVANYDANDGTYASWNADQTNKRAFIYIEPINPELAEDDAHQKSPIKKGQNNQITKGNQISVNIPYEGVTADTDLTLGIPESVPPAGGLSFTHNYRDVTLSGGVTLQKPARISISYDDADDNGTVDGTTIPETTLIMYRYDAADRKWEPLPGQIADSDNNTICACTPGFSTFGLAGIPQVPAGEEIITGSSGSAPGGHTSNQPWCKCGCIGLETLVFIFIMRLLFLSRRKTCLAERQGRKSYIS